MKWKSKGYPIDPVMLKNSQKIAKKLVKETASGVFVMQEASKKSPDDTQSLGVAGALAVYAYKMFEKNDVISTLTQNINKATAEYENKNKAKVIHDEVEYNRNLSDPKIFYLASEHTDSADDHRDAQGKIYVDKEWRKYVTDKDLRKAVNIYINKNRVKTLQYITMKPVWFITRPNCRHYFKPLSVSEALGDDVKNLIRKFDMQSLIGDREYLQNFNHPTNKGWYDDIRNAQLILDKYKERLQYHRQLFKVFKTDILKNAIRKDDFLIQKWQNYLQNKRK